MTRKKSNEEKRRNEEKVVVRKEKRQISKIEFIKDFFFFEKKRSLSRIGHERKKERNRDK